jgi:predicted enzyme related to lactoylglutathione lyase
MEVAVRNVVIDCNDLEGMCRFWETLTGYELRWSNATYRFLLDPQGRRPGLVLQRVAEVATEKNRLHLDLEAEDVTAAIRRAEELGATRIERIEEEGISWTVMRDPEGNYFCFQQAGA